MATESWPNVPHNSRAVSLPEHEMLHAPVSLTGLTSAVVAKPADADSTGLQLKIKAGTSGLIRHTAFNVTSEEVVDDIAANNSSLSRIDLLVMRLTRPGYTIEPHVIQGVPAVNPVAPSPVLQTTPGSGVYDLPLADFTVTPGAITITAAQVRNRAWWISGGGYLGVSTARPPLEPNVVFQETDTNRLMVGTVAGTWRRLWQNSGHVAATGVPAGWKVTQFSTNRIGDSVELIVRLQRTGGDVSGTTSVVIGKVTDDHRPLYSKLDLFFCNLPNHTGALMIDASGTVQLLSRGYSALPIKTSSVVVGSMTYTARP